MAKQDKPRTEFQRWRKQMSLTQAEAAEVLGVSRETIINWDTGVDRLRGREQIPTYAVRVAMAVYAVEGKMPKAWPA
jgi:DNA-binding XRE family transcriptional regulator